MSEQARTGIPRELDVVVPFIPKQETKLTPEQEEHWWRQLEAAERQVEYAKRMLGILGVEKGLSESE